MTRYVRLYLNFIRFAFSKAMVFRFDFFVRIGMDMIYYAVNIAFFKVIFLHTPMLVGWNFDQAFIFVGGFLLVDALFMTLFSNNCWWLSTYINRGDLDYYLTRPVSPLFFLTCREFAAPSFFNLVMAIGICFWAILRYPGALDFSLVPLFFLLILNGAFMGLLLNLFFIIPSFWTHSPRGLLQLHYIIGNAVEVPDRVFKGVVRKIFLFILPYSLMASVPARVLFDGVKWENLGLLVVVTTLFFFFIHWFWYKGLRSYSSASS